MTSQIGTTLKITLLLLAVLLASACQRSTGGGSDTGGDPAPQSTPACPATNVGYVVTMTNRLLCFSLSAPSTIANDLAITGLLVGENVMAVDFRPATSALYALGSTGTLYTISTENGAATAVGAPLTYTGALDFGFDFNPTVDRIRVTTDNGLNARLNPDTGAPVSADLALNYAAGDPHAANTSAIVASAYANNFAGALSTTLYGIDKDLDILVLQNPPNNGTLTTIGSLGFNTDAHTSFDIFTDGTSLNHAYAILTPPSSTTSKLFLIDLSTGAATLVGTVGGGEVIRGFSIGF